MANAFYNYLIDTDHGITVDVDASRSNKSAEVGAMRKMLDRTEERYGMKPDWIAAGTAYVSSDNLVWLTLKRQILPFIPVFHCPAGDFKAICREGTKANGPTERSRDPARDVPTWKARRYRARTSDCTDCALKAKCCPNSKTRAVHREKYEAVRELARQCTASEFAPQAQARRKKVEMLFAHLRRILGLGRLRLRGLCGVQDEFTIAATAQNLRKLAKLKPMMPVALSQVSWRWIASSNQSDSK